MKSIPKKRRARSNMLPLMDMVFLLLVLFIFMLIQMRPDFGISVTLPDVGKTSTKEPIDKEKEQVTVSVTANNTIYVNKQAADMDSLSETIKKNITSGNELEVILKGDTSSDYGKIIEIFHQLRTAGISNVLFDVDRKM